MADVPAQPARSGLPADRIPTGIALIVLTVGLFATMDTIAKWLCLFYPVVQVVWARYTFNLVALLPVLAQRGPRAALRTTRPGLQIARGVLLLASTGFFFAALSLIPIATAASIGFVGPLLVVALSAIILKEKVGPRRWTAVGVGFVGVLIIIRPGVGDASWAMLLPLATAVCFAAFQIVTRILARSDDGTTTLVWSSGVGALLVNLAVPFAWVTPEAWHWIPLVVVGALGALSHWVLILAYDRAPASVLAPNSYTNLLWTIPFGYLVFGNLPDGWMLLGAAILIACGLYVWARERQLAAQGR
jgi:drug/metabolite transporter (DMT)-like permease